MIIVYSDLKKTTYLSTQYRFDVLFVTIPILRKLHIISISHHLHCQQNSFRHYMLLIMLLIRSTLQPHTKLYAYKTNGHHVWSPGSHEYWFRHMHPHPFFSRCVGLLLNCFFTSILCHLSITCCLGRRGLSHFSFCSRSTFILTDMSTIKWTFIPAGLFH